MGVQSCGTLCAAELNLDAVDQITEGESRTDWQWVRHRGRSPSSKEGEQRGDGDAAAPRSQAFVSPVKIPACYSL